MLATVRSYSRRQGWGFALPQDRQLSDVFIHRTNLPVGLSVCRDDIIEYTPGERNGKPVALNIKIVKRAPVPAVQIEPMERV